MEGISRKPTVNIAPSQAAGTAIAAKPMEKA